MQKKRASNCYESVSLIYDRLMRSVRYDYWADYIFDIAGKYVDKNARILELGSGNCKLATELKKKYKQIIATDLSANMLRLNGRKNLPKVCCNMTSLPFKLDFDLVISTFDSVNYLLYKKDLRKLFKEVSTLLSEDGIFTFDASMEQNSIIHSGQPERTGKTKGISYKQRSIYDAGKKIHQNIFEIRLENGQIITEIHRERIYSFEDYFNFIEGAGLYVAECLDAFSFKNGGPDSKRLQFIVKKAG